MVDSADAATAQQSAHSPPRPQSATISHQGVSGPSQVHTRTYQACIPCRRRKVRCDLGPVDNPHDPPCVRCRRESKDCYFSATRRKRKSQDDEAVEDGGDLSDYEMRNGRKKLRVDDDGVNPLIDTDNPVFRRQPLRRGEGRASARDGQNVRDGQTPAKGNPPVDPQASEETTRVLTNTEVFSGHHALAMLYHAAQSGELQDAERERERERDRDRINRANSFSVHRSSFSSEPRSQLHHLRSIVRGSPDETDQVRQGSNPADSVRDAVNAPRADEVRSPVVNSAESETEAASNRAILDSALEVWSRFRFVHQGWFTAREGIQYIEYYFTNLAPLSAVPVPDYSSPASHEELLTTEPMLTITLLTIASRYMPLTGPGSRSRPHAIHEALWKCLREMIDRLLWGQEQFGGGFCGAGAPAGGSSGSQPGCDVNPLARTGLRTMGSVVSLVVLTEWHPRALHFPPGSDGDNFMLPADGGRKAVLDSAAPVFVNGTGGQPMASWLEPCWRSDRMCWMLLGLANSLAYEIGVYNEAPNADEVTASDNEDVPVSRVRAYARQRRHVRETLRIYFSQTAGRLGLTSMLPHSMRSETEQTLESRMAARLAAFRTEEALGEATLGPEISADDLPSYELVLHFWSALADLMELGNAIMFPNRRRTRDLIKTQQYQLLLQDKFHPLLRSWRDAFDAQAVRIPVLMRDVILIEYEYARVYLNSLSLQAVVERCTHDSPPRAFAAPVLGGQDGRRGPVPYADLMTWCGNDRRYVQEVTDACRATLRMAVEGLYGNGGNLRHAPVRTYFRIISVAIILLKTFVLGATEDDVSYSLSLLEQCTTSFRVCIVDDVHVSSRFADLCDTLIGRIRSRFVRLSSTGGNVRRRRRRKSMVGDGEKGQSPHDDHAQGTGRRTYRNDPGEGSLAAHRALHLNGLTGRQPPVSSSNGTTALSTGTGPSFPATLPTLQPDLSAGTPFWRIPGNVDNNIVDTQDEFPAVSILPPPGLSLVYGEDEGLVLGGHLSESEQSGSQSSHVQGNGPNTGTHRSSFSLTSPGIPVTPTITPIQAGHHGRLPNQNGNQYGTPQTPDQLQQSHSAGHRDLHRQAFHPHQPQHHSMVDHNAMSVARPHQQQHDHHHHSHHHPQSQHPQDPSAQQPLLTDTWDHWDQNWLVLPIDPILGSYGASVTQTTYGPDIGGLDMLDVLLPFEKDNGDDM